MAVLASLFPSDARRLNGLRSDRRALPCSRGIHYRFDGEVGWRWAARWRARRYERRERVRGVP